MFKSEEKYGPRLAMYLCYLSSEDEAYPAESLRLQDKQSGGWKSIKHATFPQELGFRFDGSVQLEFLRILSHESAISSCMEVHVASSSPAEEQSGECVSYQAASFQRLGHARFSTNVISHFMARELKTVGLQQRCTYLKLVLRHPHQNAINMFQQVGITGLVAHGRVLHAMKRWTGMTMAIRIGERQVVPLDEMSPPMPEDSYSRHSKLSRDVASHLAQLYTSKARAVAEEDYDLADELKQRISAVEGIEQQIVELESSKGKAIAVEDYQKAKELKRRIEELKESSRKAAASPPVTPAVQPSIPEVVAEKPRQPPTPKRPAPVYERPPVSPTVSHDDVVVSTKGYYDLNDDTGGITEAAVNKMPEVSIEGGGAPWELILNRAIEKVATSTEKPRGLTEEITATSSLYEREFGIYCTACLFSRKGQLREAAMRGMISSEGSQTLFSHTSSAWTHVMTYATLRGYGVGDPFAGAAIAACNMLQKVIEGALPGASVPQLSDAIHKAVPELIVRLGDSNTRVRESAERTIITLSRTSYGHRHLVELLLQDPAKVIGRAAGFRAHVSRIDLLSTFVDDLGLHMMPAHGFSTAALCTKVLLPSLQHSSAEVREAAVKLLAKLVCLDPASASVFVEQIKPAQQALVEEWIVQYKQDHKNITDSKIYDEMASETASVRARETHSPTPPPTPPPPQVARSPPSPSRQAGSPTSLNAGVQMGQSLHRDSPSIGEMEYRRLRTCQFCGEYNPNFSEHNLDIHYVSACPMLCPCPLCDQVTEICQLQQHLVTECEKRRLVRECPRCHEAVRASDYNEHIAAQGCIEAVPAFSVCPLCHGRFKSGMDGWRSHLATVPGCPNNPRKFDGSGLAI